MNISIINAQGEEVGTKEVLAGWDGRTLSVRLLHQAAVALAANERRPLAHTKNRGEVRGGGRKPWRQKGTGRARAGSIRSPLWKGGGVTFGPRAERSYAKRLPRSMRRAALAGALAAKARAGEVVLLEGLPESEKTKDLAALVASINRPGSLLLAVPEERYASVARAGRNLPRTRVVSVERLNASDVLAAKNVVATLPALGALEARLTEPHSRTTMAPRGVSPAGEGQQT